MYHLKVLDPICRFGGTKPTGDIYFQAVYLK